MAESASSENLPSSSKQSFREKISETQTWHTKYFHMISKWRHKIPYYSLNGTRKASYKALTQDCLLQDISYYTCIEIVGEKNLLEATLKKHCNPKKTFAAKIYTTGQKEGTLMFFKRNGYPQFPIGNVNFFWKLSETDIKTIWIWVHPAFYSDFLSEIISSFQFEQTYAEKYRADISYNLIDLYTNDAGCEMCVLKYELNRFRLFGPAALTVLREALRVPSLTELDLDLENCPMTKEQDSSLSDEELDTSTDSDVSESNFPPCMMKLEIELTDTDTEDLTIHDLKKKMWHTKYYKERANIEAFKIQELMWQLMKVLRSPSYLISNMIFGLTVLDPNSYSPVKRTKTTVPSSAENLRTQLPTDLSRSPIWDTQIRQIVSKSCVSANTTDKSMGAASVSDDPHFNKDTVAKIPILLIQKPAVASLDLGSRIDIIIPSRWAMAFWNALVKQSPLVGGLRETELVVFESLGTCVPDFIEPDTPAYMREALKGKEELTDKYFLRSPNRRINYNEFGIHSPFFCDWKNLTRGWSDVEDFYVLRHFRLLELLRAEIQDIQDMELAWKSLGQKPKFDFQEFDKYQNCLVQVQLSVLNKGIPKEFAIICMPTLEDLITFDNDEDYEPVEEHHSDPNENSREVLHKLHSVALEKLGLKLRQHEVKRENTSQDNVLPEEFDVVRYEINEKYEKMIADHEKEMRKLYLPEWTDVRHSCDREVMGYVTMGGRSFLREKGIGIGYVALSSLLELIRIKSNVVLVRNTRRRQYRFARLEILVDNNRRYK